MRDVIQTGRILRGTNATIGIQIAIDGATVTPDGTPAPRVTVTGRDGTVLVNDQEAEIVGTSVTYTLTPTHTADVNSLVAEWTVETVDGEDVETYTSEYEIVGSHLFTLAQARAYDGGAMADTTTYPAATLEEWRDGIHNTFEAITNRSFGTRFGREIHDGEGSPRLLLRAMDVSTIRAAATRVGSTWTALTADELADVVVYPEGEAVRDGGAAWPSGNRNVRLDLEYGIARVPLEISIAALRVARYFLVRNQLPDRAIMQITEIGTFQMSVAGRKQQWFGIPDVDAVLARYRVPVAA